MFNFTIFFMFNLSQIQRSREKRFFMKIELLEHASFIGSWQEILFCFYNPPT